VTRPDALERLAGVDVVVVDKTGTVTGGTPAVELKGLREGYSRSLALQTAAALEGASDHPIALAFRKHASQTRVADALKEFAGRGVEGCIDGALWRVGTPEFVGELTQASDAGVSGLSNDSGAGIALGNSDGIVATFALVDGLRPGALAAVEQLHEMGLKIVIASGDQQQVVEEVARKLGVQEAAGRMTPQAKLALVQQRESAGARVLMVGDGINDGPVLAAASVSCAMAQGSAVAQAAADLLLLNDSLGTLAEAIRTARRMRGVIRQNLTWALVYNLGAVPLAALGWIAPWVAAIGMSTSSLLVVLNAARLARSAGGRQ